MFNSNKNRIAFFSRNLDRIFFLASIIFFISLSIGVYESNLLINELKPDSSAFLYMNPWIMITFASLIFMFVVAMMYNQMRYTIILLISLFFLSITIPLIEPLGRTYDSYKYLGYADAYVQNSQVIIQTKNNLTYSSWPGIMVFASTLVQIFHLSPISFETSMFFIKSYYIVNSIVFIIGYFLLARYVLGSKIIALKSCAIVLLLLTLSTMEYSPNTSTFAMTPLLIYSILRARKEYNWILISIILILFAIVSHPFNIIIVMACLGSILLGYIFLINFQKIKRPSISIKYQYFDVKKIIFIALFIAIGYIFYSIFFGEHIIKAITDAFEKPPSVSAWIDRAFLINPPELSRRFIFLLIILFSSYIIIQIFRITKKDNNPTINKVVIFSVSSLIIGTVTILSSFSNFLTSAYGLYGRIYGYLLIVGSTPLVYGLYVFSKTSKKGEKSIKIKTTMIIVILISIPITYYISAFANEQYFAPSYSSMSAGKFVSENIQDNQLITDNILPRSIYWNKDQLSNVTIKASYNSSTPPDFFILTKTEIQSYRTSYNRLLGHAEANNYSKIYDSGNSQVYIKK